MSELGSRADDNDSIKIISPNSKNESHEMMSPSKSHEEKIKIRPRPLDIEDRPLPIIPSEAMSKLDKIAENVECFSQAWLDDLKSMPAKLQESKISKEITLVTRRMAEIARQGSSKSPKAVTGESLVGVKNEFETYKTVISEKLRHLKREFKDSSVSQRSLQRAQTQFRAMTKKIESLAATVWSDPVVGDMLTAAKRGVDQIMANKKVRKFSRHVRNFSAKFVEDFKQQASKGNLGMQSLLAASKLHSFEVQLRNRYRKVKKDVKQTLLAHMEASVRDLALIQQGNNIAKLDLDNYDFVPFVITPVLLNVIKYSTLINLVLSLMYTIIILCLLAFDFSDSCDDGIQFWFGFKMCLETTSAVFLFWIWMEVRAWETRYQASQEMADNRRDHAIDVKKGGEETATSMKVDHMICQGKDSVYTFRKVTNSISWYALKFLVFITIFYDIGAIYMANVRHCAECGASVLEVGIYIFSFWIVATMMYRLAVVVVNFFFLSIKFLCCRKRVLGVADSWDEYIGIGILHYLCVKVLFLDIDQKVRRSNRTRKLNKLVKEQTNAVNKYNEIDRRIRKLKAEIRKEERERLFQNRNVLQESGRLEMNLADPLSPMAPGMAGKMGLSKNDTKDFGRVLDQANLIFGEDSDFKHKY